MRAKIHLERLKKIEDNRAFLEVYVLEGLVLAGQIVPAQYLRVSDVLTKKKKLEKFASGTIVLSNGKFFDAEELIGTNFVLRSPNFFVDFVDGVKERWVKWQKERKEGIVKLKE